MRRSIVVFVAVLSLAVSSIVASAANAANDPWQAVKAATARFHSLRQAEAAGYVQASPCVGPPQGAEGIHFDNAVLMADDAIDATRPEVLLYVPKANGKLRLVGVEYWKVDADGNLATTGDRPSIFGQPFDGPMPGHNPTMPVHYDIHVWLFSENPLGLFAPFNPNLSCTP
jgi:hypothetical protein